jgi:hypothetical protein
MGLNDIGNGDVCQSKIVRHKPGMFMAAIFADNVCLAAVLHVAQLIFNITGVQARSQELVTGEKY